MSSSSALHHGFMRQAIELAKKGWYTTSPNPRVGCVVVKRDTQQVLGEGYHAKAGSPHAEVNALRDLLQRFPEWPTVELGVPDLTGCWVYVTLEPCSHTGRTPPCADLLASAKPDKIMVGMVDPNPSVAGKGIARLKEAGIGVEENVLKEECEQLNQGFLSRMNRKRPFVRVKMGMSLDGKIAMASGESQWITSEDARRDVQALRAEADAILSASGTVIADDPSLNVREAELPDDFSIPFEAIQRPVRVVLDRCLRVKPEARLFQSDEPVWLFCSKEKSQEHHHSSVQQVIGSFPEERVDVIQLDTPNIPLARVLKALADREINLVHVEAGPKLVGHLIEARLVDELVIYVAPDLLGNDGKGLTGISLDKLSQRFRFAIQEYKPVGRDLRIRLTPEGGIH